MSKKDRQKRVKNGSSLDGTGFEGLTDAEVEPVEWDEPLKAPGFEGATPQALARALFRPVKKPP